VSSTGLIVGITGATGAIYGVHLLERLRELEVPTHLILSPWGKRTIEHETSFTVKQVHDLATTVEGYNDMGATLSSGSFETAGMVVAPCSMKTLAGIRVGLADNLIARAADVALKERRRLVLVVRETPLNQVHLKNMLELAKMGVVIFPPVPSFYNRPTTLDEVVDYTTARVLDQLDIRAPRDDRWDGVLRGRSNDSDVTG